MIVFLNTVIALCCFMVAALETAASPPAAMAYAGFGLGYIGLAWLYGGMP